MQASRDAAALIRRAVQASTGSDAELLDRFVTARDGRAFELIVRRYGALVLGVCRRVLQHQQDAEDAFQATFLVLACKAGSISNRTGLAAWLHGVAHRTARKARARAARRAEAERHVQPPNAGDAAPDVEPALDEELARLPAVYRVPIVLCDLEGRLRSDAAAAIGCTEGTLSSRLTRGRRMLAGRLRRRGVALAAAASGTTFGGPAVAEALVRRVIGLEPAAPAVKELTRSVLKLMLLDKLRTAAAVVLVGLTVACGAATGVAVREPHPTLDRAASAAGPGTGPAPKEPAEDPVTVAGVVNVDTFLLTNRKVLVELKCDIHQLDRIMDRMELARRRGAEAVRRATGGPPGAGPQRDKRLRDALGAAHEESRAATAEVVNKMLTATQRQRLWELYLRSGRHEALLWPAVAKALGLSDRQRAQAIATVEWANGEFAGRLAATRRAAPQGAPVDSERIAAEVLDDATKRATEMLTAEQRVRWLRMMGAPFAHPLPRPFFGGTGDPPDLPVPLAPGAK